VTRVDEWEALFRIWHRHAHDDPYGSTMQDLLDLERRIVKLEAFMSSRRRPPYELR